jgi:hypothetical protein
MVRLRQTRPVPDSFGLWRHDELSRRQVEVVSTLPFLETRANLSRGGFASDKERLYISAIPHEHSLALGLWTT